MPKAGFVYGSRPHRAIGLKASAAAGIHHAAADRITHGTLPTSLLRTANASYARDVAMRLAADIVFEANLIAQIVDEARADIPRVVIGIMHGDDVLELSRADLADPLRRHQHVGVRCARGVEERLLVEAVGLNDQRVAFK